MTRTKEQRHKPAVRVDDIERMFGARRKQPADVPPLRLQVNGGTQRTGKSWSVPKTITAEAVSGKLVVDFTNAHCTRREIDLRVEAGAGAIVVIVPRGWRVDLANVRNEHGGTVSNRVKLPRFPGAPMIHVEGAVETGTVKARYAYRSPLEWLRRSR
ncbi:hypothetical protein [Nocardia inohanensis]|uniref:hypothetical protein n=1 Tax=Nocardia inohanensis TaxID=209246 RepID=UPI0012F87288|nr:hypothetical protein [Nocardia inohanensis]